MPTFEVHVPRGADQIWMRQQIREAVAKATKLGKLRPNSVDSITGENSGDNLGPGTPIIHFDQWEEDEIEVKLLLKGGGCENMNIQYSLPTELPNLGRADRTLEGVRKCILHAVWNAQGKGCAPGAVGVCIGGDRTSGYLHAKEQLFRTLDDVNPDRAAGRARSEHHGHRQHARHRHDGLRRKCQPDRLQDRRAQPAARELLRVGRLRLLGVPPARRAARRARRLHHAMALSRSEQPDDSDDRSGRVRANRTRDPLDGAARRSDRSLAEGRRRRPRVRDGCTPGATPCTRI